jgi:hypothetical protein
MVMRKQKKQDIHDELRDRQRAALKTWRRLCELHTAGKSVDIVDLESCAYTLGIRNVAKTFAADCELMSQAKELEESAAAERKSMKALVEDYDECRKLLPEATQHVANLQQRINAFLIASQSSGWAETRLQKLQAGSPRLFASDEVALAPQPSANPNKPAAERELVAAAVNTTEYGTAEWVEDDND